MKQHHPESEPEATLTPQAVASLFAAVTTEPLPDDKPVHPGLAAADRQGFTPLDKAGTGGTAQVWRGVDRNTGRDVVIKVARPVDGAIPPEHTRLLDQEADRMSRLNLSGVVTLLRRGGQGPSRFLVLPYIGGTELNHFIAEATDSAIALKVLQKFGGTVNALHHAGIAHGDLKPANIMVTPDQDVILIDLGFACGLDERPALALDHRGGTRGFLPEGDYRSWTPRCLDHFALAQTLLAVTDHPNHAALHRWLQPRVAPLLSRPSARATSRAMKHLLDPESHPEKLSRRVARWTTLGAVTAVACAAAAMWWVSTPKPVGGIAGASWAVRETLQAEPLAAATFLLASNDFASARDVLEGVAQANRGWAWRHVWARAEQKIAEEFYRFPMGDALTTTPPRAGRWAVGTPAGKVSLLSASGVVWEQQAVPGMVNRLGWSPDGETLVACDQDGNFTVLAREDGRVLVEQHLPHIRPIHMLVTGPRTGAGTRLRVVDSRDRVLDLDLLTGQAVDHGIHEGALLPRRLSDSWLAVETQGPQFRLCLTDSTGQVRLDYLLQRDETPISFDIDEAGKRIAVALAGGTVLVLDIDQGPRNGTRIRLPGFVSAVAFCEGSNLLLAAGRQVVLLDVEAAAPVVVLNEKISGVPWAAQWNPVPQTFSLQTHQGLWQWHSKPVTTPVEPTLASR